MSDTGCLAGLWGKGAERGVRVGEGATGDLGEDGEESGEEGTGAGARQGGSWIS